MVNLTFGEQVKLVLGRRDMTIKELAEKIEKRTGKKMSRQNMTQRLGRDNFQEQDMRLIAEILGCSFQLSIMEQIEDMEGVQQELKFDDPVSSEEAKPISKDREMSAAERDLTVGEFVRMNEELQEEAVQKPQNQTEEPQPEEVRQEERRVEEHSREEQASEEEKKESPGIEKPDAGMGRTPGSGIRGYVRKPVFRRLDTGSRQKQSAETEAEEKAEQAEETKILGEVNPYTGREYQTNSVRMHPKRIGYVQVYSQEKHKWTDMTEWAFLGYQERKKALLGKDYDPPIYLD